MITVLMNNCRYTPERKFFIEFDPSLKSIVFDEAYLSHIYEKKDSVRFDWNKYNFGDTIIWESRSRIIETNYPDISFEKTYDYLGIQVYKSHDTIFMFLEKDMGWLDITICGTQYTASEFMFDPYNLKKNVSSIIIPAIRSKVIFKENSLNVGDRIYGFLYIETDEFLHERVMNINFYRGAFTTTILSQEEFSKYHVPRLFL
jgi:hypothetical protein